MSKDKILGTLRPMKTTTAVKAWTFKAGGNTYQVCEFSSRMTGNETGIWQSNGTGSKRLTEQLFSYKGLDHFAAASAFLDELELTAIENGDYEEVDA